MNSIFTLYMVKKIKKYKVFITKVTCCKSTMLTRPSRKDKTHF